jgi:hypothetical protein
LQKEKLLLQKEVLFSSMKSAGYAVRFAGKK